MHKIWGESVPKLRGEFWRNKQKAQNVVIMYPGQTQNIVPSVDKGKHACQCAFAALFVLLTLAGARAPAAQKPKIARKSIAGRAIYIAEGIRWKKARKKMGREGRECIDKRGICDKIRKNAEKKLSKQPVRSETGAGESPLDAGACVPLRSGRRRSRTEHPRYRMAKRADFSAELGWYREV